MKFKKPHCNFCARDLSSVRVDGDTIGEPELVGITFDVAINRNSTDARPSILQKDQFHHTSNPIKFLADVENFVEETAEEVRCPFCSKIVKLVRIEEKKATNAGGPQTNQLQQLLQNMVPQHSGPFAMNPSTGNNRATITAIFDAKLSDQELMDILTDINPGMPIPTNRTDLLETFMDYLYS